MNIYSWVALMMIAWLCSVQQVCSREVQANPMPFHNQGTALEFIKDIYAHFTGDDATTPQLQDRDAPVLADAQLLQLFREDQRLTPGETGAFDADPICACQEGSAILDSLELSSATGDIARVKVTIQTFHDSREKQVLDYTLSRVGGVWKIHDIYNVSQKNDLLKIMQTGVEEERRIYKEHHKGQLPPP